MQALGTGAALLGMLGCVPVALWALRSASDRGFALAAVALSAVDVLFVLGALAIALLSR